VVKNVANCLMLIVQVICVTGYSVNLKMQNEKPLIRFKEDGTLKIVNFSDLHYGEAPHTDWGPAADKKSSNVTKNILEMEHPDFVIFTGDLLTAEEMYPNATEYFAILVAPLVEKNYRWASTYGNHDIGENMTRLDLLKAEQKFQQSYTLQMNASLPGVTNYYLPIYPPDKDEPVMIFWFFDSQGGRTDDGSTGKGQQPEHIDSAVISWFKEESKQVARQWGYLPSLVFFHIPPIEYINIQEHINFNPICSGLVDDDVTPQDNNTGIMQALWEVGDVQAVFVGHDHGNAWCCFYGKIQVCYNRHTGYGGYGSWTRGARVVSLNLTNLTEVNSYIRLEDGRIVDRFPKMCFILSKLVA
ncbi:putative inactive purple acid phosphatase 16, partial [Pseudolycoriella hygida]